jgi:hypothetical protein
MAQYRQIQVSAWRQDEWFVELPALDKLLFIYLFSNESASVSGIYKALPLRVMAFETGIDEDYITDALERFEQAGKVYCRDGWIWVVNLRKINASNSPKVQKSIEGDLANMPDCELKTLYIQYYSGIDTISIHPREQEQEQEQEQESEQEQDFAPAAADDAPSPPRKAKPPPRKRTKKPLREDQRLFGAVGRLCYADLSILNPTMRGKLDTACKTLREGDASADDIPDYTTYWYEQDWRGKKKQRPTPSQVVETWGAFIAWRDGRNDTPPPHFACQYVEYEVPDRPPPSELDALWAGVCAHLQGVMVRETFDAHFTRAHPARLEDGTLVVALPDDAALAGAKRLRAGAHIARYAGGVDQVEFVVEDQR